MNLTLRVLLSLGMAAVFGISSAAIGRAFKTAEVVKRVLKNDLMITSKFAISGLSIELQQEN